MPRRNSAPVQRSSRRRANLPRRGSTMIVWDSRGIPQELKVIHANRHWIDLIDASGQKTWVPTRTV